MSESAPIELLVTRDKYIDDGNWSKINLKIRLGGEFSELSSFNSSFAAKYNPLSKFIKEFAEAHQELGKNISCLSSASSISVTEIDTGREDFGTFIAELLAELEQNYDVKLSKK